MALSNSESVLEIKGLTKRFGKVHAVNELDLSIPKGVVYGLLGPNGSGKTTTLGMVLGVINPSSGDFSWFEQGKSHQLRKRIGAILEQPNFYRYLSGLQNLKVVAKIKGVDSKVLPSLLDRVSLLGRMNDPFQSYSLGMKQRLAIASALISDPEVLILDEPTNGLDPKGIADMRTLILDLASEGRTIILASHLLDEVQRICSEFTVLSKGHNIYTGSVAEALSGRNRVDLSSENLSLLRSSLSQINMVEEITDSVDSIRVKLKSNIEIEDLHRALIEKGVILSLLKTTNSLEEKFLEILSNEE